MYFFNSLKDTSFLNFMGDDFLRLLLCRHIFASCVLRAHRSFRGRGTAFQPSSRPPLPDLDLIENPTLQRYALDLAAQLDVRHLFVDSCGEVDWWRPQVGVAGATSSYPMELQIGGTDAHHVREGLQAINGQTLMSWNQPRTRQTFHQPLPTAYNNTFIPQPNPDLYMGSAGISNVMGRRRHYSGAGIVSLGTGVGGIIGSGRLGYGGTYSNSINALNNLSSTYPATHRGNYSNSINALNTLSSSYPAPYRGNYSNSINALNNLSSSYPAPPTNPTIMRHYPSHHSSSYSSLPLMTGSPTAGYSAFGYSVTRPTTAGMLHANGMLNANSLLGGNFGATSSLYRRYPSSSTTLLNADFGWRRWLKAPLTLNISIFFCRGQRHGPIVFLGLILIVWQLDTYCIKNLFFTIYMISL